MRANREDRLDGAAARSLLTGDSIVRLGRDGRPRDRVALRSPLTDIIYDGPDIVVGLTERGDVTLEGARAPRGWRSPTTGACWSPTARTMRNG